MLFVNFDLRQSAPHMIAHARKEFFIKMADVGRPKVEVDLDDVEFLLSLKLSVTKVAEILMISRSTIYRRMKESWALILRLAMPPLTL